MLGAGALGRPRGMVWGGRREEGSGWGTRVYLWRTHVDIWQNQYNIVKLKNKIKKRKKKIKWFVKLLKDWVLNYSLDQLKNPELSRIRRKHVSNNIFTLTWCIFKDFLQMAAGLCWNIFKPRLCQRRKQHFSPTAPGLRRHTALQRGLLCFRWDGHLQPGTSGAHQRRPDQEAGHLRGRASPRERSETGAGSGDERGDWVLLGLGTLHVMKSWSCYK